VIFLTYMFNAIGCHWDWIAFTIGCFGAFIMEFIRVIRANRSLTQVIRIGDSYLNIGKFNKVAVLITLVYIAIGGIISGIFANTQQEAFIYGVFWEALFTFAISVNNGDKKQ
jgi:hypothetical protein